MLIPLSQSSLLRCCILKTFCNSPCSVSYAPLLASLYLNIFLWTTVCNEVLKNVLNDWVHWSQLAAQGLVFFVYMFFLYFFLIALQNPSSKVLTGFETLQLARKVLTIFLELNYKYTEMKTDKITMPPGFQPEISNISNFFNLASFKFYWEVIALN